MDSHLGLDPMPLSSTWEAPSALISPGFPGQKKKQSSADLGGVDPNLLHRFGSFASLAFFHLAKKLYHHVGLDGSVWLTDFQSSVQAEEDEDSVMVKRLFQYTHDPRDHGDLQSVGIHEFIKKAFSRSSEHPIFEAPKESELGLSETNNALKFNFNPSLLSEWEYHEKKHGSKGDVFEFLDMKCRQWGFEEWDFLDGYSEDDVD